MTINDVIKAVYDAKASDWELCNKNENKIELKHKFNDKLRFIVDLKSKRRYRDAYLSYILGTSLHQTDMFSVDVRIEYIGIKMMKAEFFGIEDKKMLLPKPSIASKVNLIVREWQYNVAEAMANGENDFYKYAMFFQLLLDENN